MKAFHFEIGIQVIKASTHFILVCGYQSKFGLYAPTGALRLDDISQNNLNELYS